MLADVGDEVKCRSSSSLRTMLRFLLLAGDAFGVGFGDDVEGETCECPGRGAGDLFAANVVGDLDQFNRGAMVGGKLAAEQVEESLEPHPAGWA